MPNYDTDEASIIIASTIERVKPRFSARDDEAVVLWNELTELAKAYDPDLQTDQCLGGSLMAIPGKGAVRFRISDGEVYVCPCVARKPVVEKEEKLNLEYDRINKRFVGEGYDDYLNPIPGEPRKRRNALAYLAEKVMAMIEEQASERQ